MNSIKDINKAVDVIHKWWREEIDSESGTARSNRARLRRCNSTSEALTLEATHQLYAKLKDDKVGWDLSKSADKLALIVVTLANIRTDITHDEDAVSEDVTVNRKVSLSTVAKQFGRGDPPKLSAIRFQRLIRAYDPDDLTRPLCRALAQIDNRANVRELARDLLLWNDKTRIKWCFDYYGNGAAAPSASPKNNSIQNEEIQS